MSATEGNGRPSTPTPDSRQVMLEEIGEHQKELINLFKTQQESEFKRLLSEIISAISWQQDVNGKQMRLNNVLSSRIQEATKSAADQVDINEDLTNQKAVLEAKVSALESDASQWQARFDSMGSELQALRDENGAQKANLKTLRNENDSLLIKITDTVDRYSGYDDAIKNLQDQITAHGDVNALLEQKKMSLIKQ